MAHELDDWWTLYIVSDDGSANYDPEVNGKLFLKIGANGVVDRSVSRHDPGDGSTPTVISGKVTTVSTGYRVHLFDHHTVGLRRPFKGGLIARFNGQLVMAGVLLKDQPDVKAAKKRAKKTAKIAAQEEGTWVGMKP